MVRMKQAGNARRSEKQSSIGFQPVFTHTFERCFIPAHKLQNPEFQPSAEWREDTAIPFNPGHYTQFGETADT